MQQFYWILKTRADLAKVKALAETVAWLKTNRDLKGVRYAIARDEANDQYVLGFDDYATATDHTLMLAAAKRVERWGRLAPFITRWQAKIKVYLLPLDSFVNRLLK